MSWDIVFKHDSPGGLVEFDANGLDFGTVSIGSSKSLVVYITNIGIRSDVIPFQVAVAAPFSGGWTRVTAALPAGQNQAILFTFTPTKSQSYANTCVVTAIVNGRPFDQYASLLMTGVGQLSPVIPVPTPTPTPTPGPIRSPGSWLAARDAAKSEQDKARVFRSSWLPTKRLAYVAGTGSTRAVAVIINSGVSPSTITPVKNSDFGQAEFAANDWQIERLMA